MKLHKFKRTTARIIRDTADKGLYASRGSFTATEPMHAKSASSGVKEMHDPGPDMLTVFVLR